MNKISTSYPYLPAGRGILYASENDPFMAEAKRMRNEHSTDASHPTGAVLVANRKIIGWAANQSALKNKRLIALHKNGWCIRRILKVPTGKKYWICPGCAKLKHHAEARAVKDAKKRGNQTVGADLYLYGHWWCCEPCWDAMIEAGVKDVYLVEGATELFKK